MRSQKIRRYFWVPLLVGVMCSTPSAFAEEPKPTPAPDATKTETQRPKSLADLAGGIKLQDPNGQKEGGVVIDNSNLKEMGEGAVISQGKGLGGSSAGSPARGIGSDPQAPSDADLDKARQDVELLKAQLAAIDKATEENKAVNLYSGMGPQYRAPGQTDPLQNQREDLEKKLGEAQGAYDALEKQKAEAAKKSGSGQGSRPVPVPSTRKPVTR